MKPWGQITRHVAGGNASQPQQSDRQMREILAHTTAGLQDIVETGMNMGPRLLVIELVAHLGHDSRHVDSDVLGLRRPRHPEELV